MTSLSYTVADSATMLRRNLRHMQRYPSLTVMVLGIPVILLLIFVYVFGGTLGAGLGHVTDGRAAYIRFVIPGILLLTLAGAVQATAVTVAMDMTTGIIARFRTMSIARASVLTGHVLGSMIQAMLGVGAIIGMAFLIGFRSPASPLAWLAACVQHQATARPVGSGGLSRGAFTSRKHARGRLTAWTGRKSSCCARSRNATSVLSGYGSRMCSGT